MNDYKSFKTESVVKAIDLLYSSNAVLRSKGERKLLGIKNQILNDKNSSRILLESIQQDDKAASVGSMIVSEYNKFVGTPDMSCELVLNETQTTLVKANINVKGKIVYSTHLDPVETILSWFDVLRNEECFGPLYCWALVNMQVFYIAHIYREYMNEVYTFGFKAKVPEYDKAS